MSGEDGRLELTENDLRINSETYLAEEERADRRQRRRLRDLTNHAAAIALGIGLIGLFAVVFLGPASIHASAMQLIGVIVGAAAASLWSGRNGSGR